jgi:hypothetical protein
MALVSLLGTCGPRHSLRKGTSSTSPGPLWVLPAPLPHSLSMVSVPTACAKWCPPNSVCVSGTACRCKLGFSPPDKLITSPTGTCDGTEAGAMVGTLGMVGGQESRLGCQPSASDHHQRQKQKGKEDGGEARVNKPGFLERGDWVPGVVPQGALRTRRGTLSFLPICHPATVHGAHI